MSIKKLIKKESRYFIYLMFAQFIFILASLFVNYKVEKLWGVEGFASYNIIKKLGAFVVFILVLGTGIGIPRYISFIKKRKTQGGIEYLLAGLIIFLIAFSFFLVVLFLFPSLFTVVVDVNFNKQELLLILALYIFSQGVFIVFSSYLRGVLKFVSVSFLNIGLLSLAPLIFLYFSEDILNYFWHLSISNACLLLTLIFWVTFKNQKYNTKILKFKIKQLLGYGSPRVLADMSLFSLDFLPIYLIGVFISLPESGYLSLSLLFFKLATLPFELVGSLLIPVLGEKFKNNPKNIFIKKVKNLVNVSVLVSIFFTLGLWFLVPYITTEFFSSMIKSIAATKYIILTVPFYVMFLLFKNVLDIVSVKAYNSWLLTLGMIILLLILSLGLYLEDWFYFRVLPIIITYIFLGISSAFLWIKVKRKL